VLGGKRLLLIDDDARFLNERSGDDEKDQQVQNEIQHWRQIDSGFFAFFRMTA
jgi:hypothetical protein